MTKALNTVGFVVMLWALLIPIPYLLVVICCLVLPFIAVWVMAWAPGLVNLNSARRSKQPHVAIAFIGPCIALCLRAVFDVQFVSYKPALVPSLAVGLALTALTCAYAPDIRQRGLNVFLVLPFALCYGYGFFVQLNCLPDNSKPAEYSTQIINKRVNNGSRGGKYYYVDFQPCGPFTNTQEVRVSRSKFEKYAMGEPVTVKVKNGTLGAKWFYITAKRP